MKKTLLLLMFTFSIAKVSAQQFEMPRMYLDTITDANYHEIYDELKELYVKKLFSKSYLQFQPILETYQINLHHKQYRKEIAETRGGMNRWATLNLEKTEFKTIEEAENAYYTMVAALNTVKEENPEYDKLEKKVIFMVGGAELYEAMLKDVMAQYPDRYKNPLSGIFNKK